MPYRVLRAAMLHWIEECCNAEDACNTVDRLIEMGVRPPTLTITEAADLDAIPNGSAVLVGDLRQDGQQDGRLGQKQEHCIMFAGEDEVYPFHADGLAPPLPCTVIWLPQESRRGFALFYAQRQSDRFGLDVQELMRDYGEEGP